MNVIVPGHKYDLDSFEGSYGQELCFIHKEPVSEGSKELVTIQDGTTNEEVLAVLIDRLIFLNKKFPCRENSVAITHIETALLWLNHRTAQHKLRGVEGKHEA